MAADDDDAAVVVLGPTMVLAGCGKDGGAIITSISAFAAVAAGAGALSSFAFERSTGFSSDGSPPTAGASAAAAADGATPTGGGAAAAGVRTTFLPIATSNVCI